MNSLAERRNQIFCLRRGKPIKQKVKGTGRYKAFTPGTMLKSTFLYFVIFSCVRFSFAICIAVAICLQYFQAFVDQ